MDLVHAVLSPEIGQVKPSGEAYGLNIPARPSTVQWRQYIEAQRSHCSVTGRMAVDQGQRVKNSSKSALAPQI
jgi:hypothetical protein